MPAMGVSTGPGEMALTLIFRPASSAARTRTIDRVAALVAA